MAASDSYLLEIEAKLKGAAGVQTELGGVEEALDASKAAYKGFEKEASSTAAALEKLGAKASEFQSQLDKATALGDIKGADKAKKALAGISEKQTELAKKAATAKSALKAEGAALEALADDFVRLKKAEDAAGEPKGFKERIEGVKKLTAVGGIFGDFAGKIGDSAEGLEGLGVGMGAALLGSTLLVGGVLKLGSAFVSAALDAAKLTLELADQRRTMGLTLEAMAGSVEGGQALKESFHEITASTGITGDRLTDLTRDLQKANVSAEDLPLALRAIATQEQALGSSDGSADLIKSLEEGKKSAGDLASEMESKFGGVVEQKMLSLDNQVGTLKEHFGSLLDNLNLEPLLQGFDTLISLLDGSTESGQAIQQLMSNFFAMLGGDGTDAFTAIEGVALDVLIAFVRLDTSVTKIDKGLKKLGLGGLGDIFEAIVPISGAFTTAEMAAENFGMQLDVLGTIADDSGSQFDALSSTADEWATEVGDAIDKAAKAVTKKLGEWVDAGANLIKGLIKGMKSQFTTLEDTAADAAEKAREKLEQGEEIRSPSRKWARDGAFMGEGLALGLESSIPDVLSAVDKFAAPLDLMSMVDAMPMNDSGPVSVSESSPISVEVTNIFHGVENAEQISAKVEESIVRIFEGRLAQTGGRRGRRRARAA